METYCDSCGKRIPDDEICYCAGQLTLCGNCMDEYNDIFYVDGEDNENEQKSGEIDV
ncbi:hypothetical protein [uncultured Draconibacterium sp.]|uniref:hypothetical protein n=1 Tax=uncultured Draconibacterium sp. TaxID=1573823 RepID=UPI0025D6E637|nr:hypothetical protein [uncultured Draconibacterium sp.]